TLETQVKERTSELQALYDLSQQIGYALTFDDLARSVLTHLQHIVPSDIAATVLRIDGLSLLIVNHRSPINPSEVGKIEERLLNSFSTVARMEIEPTHFTIQLEEGEGYDASNPPVDDLESAFMVPLSSGGTTLGIIFIGSKEKYSFNEDQIRFFYTIANHFLTALQQLRLRHSMEERRMENVVAEIPDGLLLLDSENRIRMANPMAQEYLQLLNTNTSSKPGEILTTMGGHSLEEILNSSKQSQHHEIAAGDSSTEIIFEIVSKKVRIKDSPRTLLIIRDVSEMRLTQKGMRQRERLAAVGQLAAGIAHDFNNILQGIIGYSELLERSPEISEKSRNYIKNIVQQGQRAAYLIKQILDFSRQSITKSQSFNLAPLIQETVKFFKRTIPENIDLSLDIEMDKAMIQADIVHVQQVLTNMVLNARDAMPDGGALKVRLHPFLLEKGDTPPITGMAHSRWVAFSVTDTGCGIASEVLPSIFDPFFTTKEQGKGTGLGLSQAYGLVKQDNGFIHVDSNPGEGATFTVYLPELLNDDVKEPVLMTEIPLKGGGETILLVEDDAVVMDVNKSMLENLGYAVLTASNGREALEVCRSEHERITLLLSDITMPEMNGIELLNEVRGQFPSLKVILMTGYPLPGENVKDLKDMDVICLQKPVNLKQLASTLQHVFGEGRESPKVRLKAED
ncbi:MAG: response regulator, partial [Deltaproteobacteria bacterium]|nr:response regulator [Deltaproteobacteria bacterium]